MNKKLEQLKKMEEDLAKTERIKKELEAQNVDLMEQKNNLYIQLQTEQDTVIELEERVEQLVTQKADFETQMKEMEDRLMDEEDAAAELEGLKKKMEGEMGELKRDIEDLETTLAKVSDYTGNILKHFPEVKCKNKWLLLNLRPYGGIILKYLNNLAKILLLNA